MRTATAAWEEAVRSFGIEPEPRITPNPVRWLLYAMWIPLPQRHRLWVLYDTTCSTWVLRHFARIIVLAAIPTVVIALVLPASLGLKLLIALTTGGVAFLLTAVWVNEGTEHRLAQADWPWDF